MKFYLISIVFIFFVACKDSRSINLDSDIVAESFTDSEVKGLNKILYFFENNICNDSTVSRDSCYINFSKLMLKNANQGLFKLDITLDEQKELYESLDFSLFKELWIFGYSRRRKQKDTIKTIELRMRGKYEEFIKKMSRSNPYVKDYYENFLVLGDIGPSMTASLLYEYEKFEPEKSEIKLLTAIHYLTLNDQRLRTEKYVKP